MARSKSVKVIDVENNTFCYTTVSGACMECSLPIWYAIYQYRYGEPPRKYKDKFDKISKVIVDDNIVYEKTFN